MGRYTWDLIKQSKGFYVNTFRWTEKSMFISVALNLILGLLLYYVYFNQPESDFYATYGETPPVALTPMDEPNYSSTALLANDTGNDSNVRKPLQ